MNRLKHMGLWCMVSLVVVGGLLNVRVPEARAEKDSGVTCFIDVVVETRGSTGTVLRETYQKEFVLADGVPFFDDFSTRTRFKFFDASLSKENGDSTISINWYADVTVFNSVDFDTSVVLSDGQKSGRSTGRHTFYTSGSSTTTYFTLTCVEN